MEKKQQKPPIISVVIPMYNCEQFIRGILSMFADQSLRDFEVICVIDGATDGTEEAVKNFCETDERFRYVVRKNGGAGAARNTGIDEAKGKYIVFPDADDVFEKDFLLKLYEIAEKYDAQMALCGAVTYDYLTEEKRKIYGYNKSEMSEGEVYSSKHTKHLLKMIDTSNQNKMFLIDFIKNTGIRFSETPASNDLFFSKATIASAERIVVVNDDLVTIRLHINPNSISSNRRKYSHIAISELRKLYNWLDDRNLLVKCINDWLVIFDTTVNYEMKNGTNPLFANELARSLNCEEPWKKLNSKQIKQILVNSLGEDGGEVIKKPKKNATDEELKKLGIYNAIINKRNENKLCMQEMIKRESVEYFSRDFDDSYSKSPYHKTEGLNHNISDVSPKNGDSCKDFFEESISGKRLIVSLTSYPARINILHLVIESIYDQTIKPDRIILWLANEQFPNKDEDLPYSVLKDVWENLIDLRWCDDLGSHKKYYYTMREFPNDIIVTVDDDVYYDPHALETLYESYLRFPTAVSANRVSCMLFDSEGELLTCSRWIIPFEVIKNTPSLQLMAIGSHGILYPPGIFDDSVFDVKTIKQLCNFENTFFINDSWLKIHEIINKVPVVYTGRYLESYVIKGTQVVRLKNTDEKSAFMENKENELWSKMQSGFPESQKLKGTLSSIKESPAFIRSEEDGVLDNIVDRFRALTNTEDVKTNIIIHIIHNSIQELNRLKSLGVPEKKWNSYIKIYQSILRECPEPGELSERTISFYAVRDYGFVLKTELTFFAFRYSEYYNQMLLSWRIFFSEHPECDEIYLKGYDKFIRDMCKAEAEGTITVQLPLEKIEDPAVSVVIPMYNCEQFVPGVLSVFASQTFSKFEVICVIDGATDNTEDNVKKFCETDHRFRYVVRENGGAGAARNTGMENAKGKYIVFADADDEYYPEYLQKLYEAAEKHYAQMVMCLYTKEDYITQTESELGFNKNRFHENTVYSHRSISNLFNSFVTHIPNTLFNADFLRKNEVFFPEARVGEDACFNYAALSVADRIIMLHDNLMKYRYHFNQESLSSNRIRYSHEALDAHRWLYKYLKDHSSLDAHFEDYLRRVDDYISYEGGNGVTPRFISEFARMLNAEEPFDGMTSEEILTYLKEGIFAENAAQKETELKNNVDLKIIEADKGLSFLLNVYRNRIHTAELIRKVSKEQYGRDFERNDSLPYDSALHKYLPKKVRLEASTICQLRCAGCGFQKGGEDDLGRGYLTIDNFRRFCEMNPFVNEIELSNWGELFLNPDLVKIMYEAKARGIKLFASNGSNFNTVSDEQMRTMVDTGFEAITLSIDGASQEIYSKYRIGGDFDKVIENVRKIQRYKAKENTKLPRLKWQYILMEHNELEIEKAKKLAKELGINIEFKYNWDAEYHPINREYIMRETGLTELTRAEYVAVNGVYPYELICRNFFLKPQINWDGRLLGCCDQKYASFDVNVFEVGLEAAMKSLKYIQAKECLLSVHPDKEKYGSCICFNCKRRMQREKAGVALEL